ncbi:hypothetical protein SAMN05216198_1504 [Halopseudomonas litoralis]|uniref:Uncharacterized protein n=1 Tax=Halopseudomonas litoralis TaxID=797277 RepID=A0A1H1QJV9_9GAMM|nr:hypothetical protein SAMN05216198_1504 [Halopseudomonas litoralis]
MEILCKADLSIPAKAAMNLQRIQLRCDYEEKMAVRVAWKEK